MKKTFAIILFLVTFVTLISCSEILEYRNDISCKELTEKIEEAVAVEGGYSEYDEEQIKFFFEDTSAHNDFSIIYSTNAEDINEIGVFHCPDEKSTLEIYEVVSRYLDSMQKTQVNFIAGYAPHELPKLEAAELRRYGNYVIYTILDTKYQKTAWSVAENYLTVK